MASQTLRSRHDTHLLQEKGVRKGCYKGTDMMEADGLLALVDRNSQGQIVLFTTEESYDFFLAFNEYYHVVKTKMDWDPKQVVYRNTWREETTYSYVEDRIRHYQGVIPWSTVEKILQEADERGDGPEYVFCDTLDDTTEFEDALPLMAGLWQCSPGSKSLMCAFCQWVWAFDMKMPEDTQRE